MNIYCWSFKCTIQNEVSMELWINQTKGALHVKQQTNQTSQEGKWLGKIKPQPLDDKFAPENLLDWHSQVYVIFEKLLQVQQCLSGIKWTYVIDGKEFYKKSFYKAT